MASETGDQRSIRGRRSGNHSGEIPRGKERTRSTETSQLQPREQQSSKSEKRIRLSDRRSTSSFQSNTTERDKKKKKKPGPPNKTGAKRETQSGEDSENEPESLEPVLSYRPIEQHEGNFLVAVLLSRSQDSSSELHATVDHPWSIQRNSQRSTSQ